MKSSPMLLNFYQAWLAGSDRSWVRSDSNSLCVNLGEWMWKNYYKDEFDSMQEDMFWQQRDALAREMKQQFMEEGLNVFYPFHKDYTDYVQETVKNACATNPLRVQWVQDRIKDMEGVE